MGEPKNVKKRRYQEVEIRAQETALQEQFLLGACWCFHSVFTCVAFNQANWIVDNNQCVSICHRFAYACDECFDESKLNRPGILLEEERSYGVSSNLRDFNFGWLCVQWDRDCDLILPSPLACRYLIGQR